MQVKLVRHTPEPEKTVAMSARLCYSPIGAAQLEEKISDEQAAALVRKLVSMGHFSTLEHVTFTFAIEGVSRVLTHQLVRHRIASYSQQSQRYVKEHNFEVIMPPSIAAKPEAKAEFEDLMQKLQDAYNKFTEMGIPAEDARYVLPNAAETKIVCTFNARSLLNFFSLRCCMRAQWEIRALAEKMLAECKRVAPVIFENAGPTCVSEGICREGAMSCGRLEAILKAKKAAGEVMKEEFIAGRNPVAEALRSGRALNKVMVQDGARGVTEIIAAAREKGVAVQGVVAYAAPVEFKTLEDALKKAAAKGEAPFLLLLDELQDPQNLGALIRTADAAGVHGILLPKRRSCPLNAVVAKISAGAVEYVPVIQIGNIVQQLKDLKKQGFWVAGADMDGEPYTKANLTGPLVLVIGAEGKGLGRLVKENCDIIVSLPMQGGVNSLNAAAAGAVLMYEVVRQRGQEAAKNA